MTSSRVSVEVKAGAVVGAMSQQECNPELVDIVLPIDERPVFTMTNEGGSNVSLRVEREDGCGQLVARKIGTSNNYALITTCDFKFGDIGIFRRDGKSLSIITPRNVRLFLAIDTLASVCEKQPKFVFAKAFESPLVECTEVNFLKQEETVVPAEPTSGGLGTGWIIVIVLAVLLAVGLSVYFAVAHTAEGIFMDKLTALRMKVRALQS